MGFLKLLNIGLILISTTVFCVANTSEITYRLPINTIPRSYNVRLIPHLEKGSDFTFYGEIDVIFEIISQSSNISLHSQELEINKIATTLIKNNGATYKPVEHIHNDVTNILTLKFDHVLLGGFYTLYMKFLGNITESSLKAGFMKIPHIEEDSTTIVTLLEPNSARRLFPCFDEPALKATFNISVRHHQKYKVLSNMPMREQVVEQNDMVWTHFDTTPVMSTYLVGIVISNFVPVSNADKTVNVWCRSSMTSQAKFVLGIAENITSLLVQYTNISLKVPKMDHVMVYNYPVNGMEHWGLIVYSESELVYDDSTDPIYKKNDVALLVAHELVHQWFGNLVTPSWWSDLWLSEGFSMFFESYFLNKAFEEWRIMDLLVVKYLHRSLAVDNGLINSITLELDDNDIGYNIFNIQVYYKAPVILRMLHHAITEEVFQKGIKTYLTRHQFGSVTADDLWSAMQSALNESHTVLNENLKIKEVMDTWTNQKCYPVLNVTRNYKTGEVTIIQKCFCANDTNDKWWIPITFATESNPDFYKTMPNYWLRPDQAFVRFEVNLQEWIIVNVQQTAYCRVYYDSRNWYRIIRYLNSEKYTNIHVLNRAQLIDDAYVFLTENQIHKNVFLNLINYLSREKDYIAWSPMFQILNLLSSSYPLPESESFKSHMLAIFDKLLQHIGYAEHPNDADTMKRLRLDATKWACTFGHEQCKRMAAIKLNEHLTNPNTYKVREEWQDWTYCFGLAIANRTTWDKMFELYRQTRDKKIGKFLSCSENPDIIISYLNILASSRDSITSTKLFDDETHSSIFKTILEKHANNGLILDYILKHLNIIKPRLIITNLLIKFFIFSNVYSNEQMDKLKKYSEINFTPVDVKIIDKLIEIRKKNLKKIGDDFARKFQFEKVLT